jgi:AMP phosphorylase
MLSLRAKLLDMEAGLGVVVLHEQDADELGVHVEDRVRVSTSKAKIVAVVNVTNKLVQPGEIGASIEVKEKLGLKSGVGVQVSAASRPSSVDFIKKKMAGKQLSPKELYAIVDDVVAGNLSPVEMTAFVTTEYIQDMSMDEVMALTRRMADSGDKLKLDVHPTLDIHSIGGIPGNKYALVTVPIVAAAGLVVPKTSSRAITSSAGTADVMEVLANVTLSLDEIKEIIQRVGAVLAWGGAVKLAPADDIIITAERKIGVDPKCQMLASVLAKKLAVNADNVLIDIPTGPGAKVEKAEAARSLAHEFMELGRRLEMRVETVITYGGQPLGYAIGPALEAREALETLMGRGPGSLIEKSTSLAGIMLELGGVASIGTGEQMAHKILASGKAWKKMREIIEAQGGDPNVKPENIPIGEKKETVVAPSSGYITRIDNHRITKIARAAGAPRDKGAGAVILLKEGRKVNKGDPLFEIYAEHEKKLDDAILESKKFFPIKIEGMVLERVSHKIRERLENEVASTGKSGSGGWRGGWPIPAGRVRQCTEKSKDS